MVSRRDMLTSVAAVAAALIGRRPVTLCATASQPATPVNFDVPAGACDCHTHIFGDARRFPFAAGRTYTPEPASVVEMRALHEALHVARVVIVQASVYGTDNACTLDAIGQLGPRARGVAVIDDGTSESALEDMHRAGIRGVRVNLETYGQTDPVVARQRLNATFDRVKSRGWHVQIYTRLSVVETLRDEVLGAPVPVVFDHFGGARGEGGVGQPGFETLLDLVRRGNAYVKISAPYRLSTRKPDYPDMTPLAAALIAANPQRIVWGTDWPHTDSSHVAGRKVTDIAPLQQIDDGRALNQLAVWAPDPVQRKAILVDNPAKLYGF